MSSSCSEWSYVPLQEVVGKVTSGGTPKADMPSYYGGDIPFLKIHDLTISTKFVETSKLNITESGLQNSSAKIFPAGTVLTTMYGTIGVTRILKKPMATNQAIAAFLELKDITPEFLLQLLNFEADNLAIVSSQTTQANISASILKEYIVNVPPLPEQKKIASILTSVDEVIENTQKQIDKLQDLKKATMNELLTKGIGHTEFKDSELGMIPKSWEIVSLLSLSKKIKRGPSLSCNTQGKGIRYITSGNLVCDEVSLEGDYKFLDNFSDIEKCRILKNDLILNCVNSAAKIGGSAIFSLNIDAIVGFNNYAITLHTDVCDPGFIHYFTKMYLFKRQLRSVLKDAINQVSFSTKDLGLIQIALPPKLEQSEISQNIDSILKNEKILTQKIIQNQSLKKSLMQDLLTGKIRVSVD